MRNNALNRRSLLHYWKFLILAASLIEISNEFYQSKFNRSKQGNMKDSMSQSLFAATSALLCKRRPLGDRKSKADCRYLPHQQFKRRSDLARYV
ncbi:hypothetical protein CDAR_91891 [Caerostris darwini]|uniref:Secreted protein n=1 Tax=Caerostris darwini TaxID=1538125 RepID=A0AAV4QSG8_9ARAC|nr:hypothetical protein CDAR_91891 [Caerostris darwini]